MGGDFSPQNEVSASIDFLKEDPSHHIVLIGDQDTIRKKLDTNLVPNKQIEILHSKEAIGMSDSIQDCMRSKNSSMAIGHQLLKENGADIFISTGNTGAQIALASHILGRIEGINRASIGAFLPNSKGFTFLIDVGSNIQPKAIHFLQNAIMSDILSRYIYDKENPSISMLNIGSEPSKGTELNREIYSLLEKSSLNFQGNIEGNNILGGHYDIVLSDGFSGNIVLKLYESIAPFIQNSLKAKSQNSAKSQSAYTDLKADIDLLVEEYNYQSYGGVPILGINGISMICHGRSSSLAIQNAMKQALKMHEKQINQHIQNEIHKI